MKKYLIGTLLNILNGIVPEILKRLFSSKKKKPEFTEEEDNQMVKKVDVKGTPFTAIRASGKWFLAFGKYRITEELPSLEACELDAKREDWDRIIQIMVIVTENTVNRMDNAYLADRVKEQLELQFKNGKEVAKHVSKN